MLSLIPRDIDNNSRSIKTTALIQRSYLFAIILQDPTNTTNTNSNYNELIVLIQSLTLDERLALISTNINTNVTIEQCILLLDIVHDLRRHHHHHHHHHLDSNHYDTNDTNHNHDHYDTNFIEELRIHRYRYKQLPSYINNTSINDTNNANANKSFYEKFGKGYEFDRDRYRISRWNKVPCSDDPTTKENNCTFKPAISKKGYYYYHHHHCIIIIIIIASSSSLSSLHHHHHCIIIIIIIASSSSSLSC